jgi:activating signal cointegrator 1
VKALTLTEPWATLVALREKRVETRSWKLPNSIIGVEVAIHAAKGFPRWAKDCAAMPTFKGSLGSRKLSPGNILCVVRFIGHRFTQDVRNQLTEKELSFGDYNEGRFAWFIEYVVEYDPTPAIGHLGFWDWKGSH